MKGYKLASSESENEPLLRFGVNPPIGFPSRQTIDEMLGELHLSPFPVAAVSIGTIVVEVESAGRQSFLAARRLGTGLAYCTVGNPIGANSARTLLAGFSQRNPQWDAEIVWRECTWLEKASDEASAIAEWVGVMTTKLRKTTAHLAEEARHWVFRRLVWDRFARPRQETGMAWGLEDSIARFEIEQLAMGLIETSEVQSTN